MPIQMSNWFFCNDVTEFETIIISGHVWVNILHQGPSTVVHVLHVSE